MPSLNDFTLFLTAIVAALGSLSSVCLIWYNVRETKRTRIEAEQARKLAAAALAATEEVHKATNSLQDKLVIAVRKAAHAAGVKKGRAEKRGQR